MDCAAIKAMKGGLDMEFSHRGLGREVDRRTMLGAALGAGAVAASGLSLSGCSSAEAKPLTVGGLAVTCNLTLPVACAANAAAHRAEKGDKASAAFEYSKYTGWPEVKESLMSGEIQAAYMLAPLVMDLADKKVPVKIVSIGHRSGAVIMVRTDSPYRSFRDLAGKRVAIPSRFAVDFLFLRKMLAMENMTVKDVEIVEMAPADMPAALYVKGVDAYCTGEPFGAAAQKAGYARPLRMTRDEWPRYMCCVLTVREELIKDNRPLVQDLVNHVLGAGLWLDQSPANREKAIQIAAGRDYFNQDPNVLRFVMTEPPDRVTYGDLRMVRNEFDELMRMSVDAGTLKNPVPFAEYVDESFALAGKPAPIML